MRWERDTEGGREGETGEQYRQIDKCLEGKREVAKSYVEAKRRERERENRIEMRERKRG